MSLTCEITPKLLSDHLMRLFYGISESRNYFVSENMYQNLIQE